MARRRLKLNAPRVLGPIGRARVAWAIAATAALTAVGGVDFGAGTGANAARAEAPFFMGADVSLLPFIEQRGGVFRDGGQAKPAEKILVDHGANLFRLRLFVNPDPSYNNTSGAIQDLNYTIALAQRLKSTGARFLLDFHYSDTWADPGHQSKPAAWSGHNFAQLNTAVHDYTRDALLAFKSAGVMPHMVQVGNEITTGMLWNDGRIISNGTTATNQASWQKFGQLLNSAIDGVRDAESAGERVRVAVHIDRGNQPGLPRWYFDNLHTPTWGNVSDYDVMGVSFYPSGTETLANLQANLNDIVTRYDRNVMVLETNHPWKGSGGSSAWARTPTGQQQFLEQLRDVVRGLPDDHGEGVVWWYPEAVQVPGTFVWQGGAIALFDASGNTLPAVNAMAGNWPPRWNATGPGDWQAARNWSGGVPNAAGASANFTSVATAAAVVTVAAPVKAGSITFDNATSYTISGAATMTLDATAGNAVVQVITGNHAIAAPLALADAATVNVAPVASTLTLSNVLPSSVALTKAGQGALIVNAVNAASLAVDGGLLKIAQGGGGASSAGSIAIANGATVDLTNNKLIVRDGDVGTAAAGVYGGIHGLVQRAYHEGAWDRAGITTSMPQALDGLTTVAVLTGEQYGGSTFAGQSISPTSKILMYTYAGDTNLDGVVTGDDYGTIDFAILVPGADGYYNGDFNYDGVINGDDYGSIDFTIIAQGAPITTSAVGGGTSTVPEPANALAGAAVARAVVRLTRRRRRAVAYPKG